MKNLSFFSVFRVFLKLCLFLLKSIKNMQNLLKIAKNSEIWLKYGKNHQNSLKFIKITRSSLFLRFFIKFLKNKYFLKNYYSKKGDPPPGKSRT
jgi:hypothetical protein